MMIKSTRISVAAGVIFRRDRVLIARRLPDRHLAGHWEFPGGKVRSGESFEACLRREIREELGIEIQVRNLLTCLDHDYPERKLHLRFFHCLWLEGTPRCLACADFIWVGRFEIGRFQFPEADRELLSWLVRQEDLWR